MIILDVEPLQNPAYIQRGIGRYVLNLVTALERSGERMALCYNNRLSPPAHNLLPPNVELIPATAQELTNLQPEWLITCSPFERSHGSTTHIVREYLPSTQHALIVYDLIPLIYPEYYLRTAQARASYTIGLEILRKADLILTISENTKVDVLNKIDSNIKCINIGAGVEDFFRITPDLISIEKTWYEFTKLNSFLHKRYIFTVSGAHYSKNLTGVLDAYARCSVDFRLAHPLVIGGGIDEVSIAYFQNYWRNSLHNNTKLEAEPYYISKVDDVILRELYRRCFLFIYGSRYEGFGLPLAEAFVSGAVCCCVNSSSLPEIIDNPKFCCSVNEPEVFSRLIQDMTLLESRRDKFFEWAGARKRFSWSDVSERLLEALVPKQHDNVTSKKITKRYAIVGPLPPERSGIAVYNSAMLPLFVSSQIFDWFTPQGHVAFDGGESQYPLSVFLRNIDKYHETIYIIGNSSHHVPTISALMRSPGVVWLHDVQLDGLAWDYANYLSPESPCSELNKWLTSYDASLPAITSLTDVQKAQCMFARPLLSSARAFIVHSNHARRLLRRDLGGIIDQRPIFVVPLAMVNDPLIPWLPRGDTHEIKIGMIGFMAPIRCPEIVIRAAAVLKRKYQKVSIVIAGYCESRFASELTEISRGSGVEIVFTGYVDERDFEAIFRVLDVLVQLRRESKGESSATISHGLELGMPIVTNLPSALEVFADTITRFDLQSGPEILAETIERAIENSTFSDRMTSLQNLKADYSPSLVFEKILECISHSSL